MITDKEELSTIVKGNSTMEDAKKKLEDLSSQEELFTEYELEQLNEYCDMLGKEEIRKESHELGLKEGHELGLHEGRAEGEKKKAIEVAKSLMKQNIDFSAIQKATGLSLDELNALKEEM